jgi:hypothetical protein
MAGLLEWLSKLHIKEKRMWVKMPFHLEEIEQKSFSTWEELNYFIDQEQDKYTYVPFNELFIKEAKFTDDKFIGRKGYWLKFNEDGMDDLCDRAQIPFNFLEKLSEDGLVSKILNNYLTNNNVRGNLGNYYLVVDEKNMTITGLVTKAYVPYTNQTFMHDIKQLYPELHKQYEIEESYIINTNLYLRLLSKNIKAGIINGKGGTSEDISRIGLQLSNGMTGRSSLKVSYFVYRLLCSNGLIMPCAEGTGVVKHSGKIETFYERISKNITPVIDKVRSVPKQIETLGMINFDLEKFVELDGAKYVYDIIPLSYWENIDRNKRRGNEKRNYDIDKINQYIEKYSLKHSSNVFLSYYRDNQSMFDFVNIFTEYAQTKKPRERVKMEEMTGKLASWILNKKKSYSISKV